MAKRPLNKSKMKTRYENAHNYSDHRVRYGRYTKPGSGRRDGPVVLAWNHGGNHEKGRADGVARHTTSWNIGHRRPQSVEAVA